MVRDTAVLAETAGDPSRTHGQRLPGELAHALSQADVGLADVDLLAIATGPGSFTGLRVGLATMQGLASSRALKIVPVSSFEALADQARREASRPALIAPWIDAQRGEVFATLYAPDCAEILLPASSASPAATLRAWRAALGTSAVLFIGDGAVRYREAIASEMGDRAWTVLPEQPQAATIGRIAAREPQRAVLPHAVAPVYVRRSDAELARERSAAR